MTTAPSQTTVVPRRPWWRDGRRRTRVAVAVFAALALGSMLYAAVAAKLLGGDQRVVVVTMENGAGQQAREDLKRACGSLPGVTVVPDRGNPDARVQGRFPVRFSVSGATTSEVSALVACLNDPAREGVLGFLTEGD